MIWGFLEPLGTPIWGLEHFKSFRKSKNDTGAWTPNKIKGNSWA